MGSRSDGLPGLRRWNSLRCLHYGAPLLSLRRSQPGDQRQDFLEHLSRHRDGFRCVGGAPNGAAGKCEGSRLYDVHRTAPFERSWATDERAAPITARSRSAIGATSSSGRVRVKDRNPPRCALPCEQGHQPKWTRNRHSLRVTTSAGRDRRGKPFPHVLVRCSAAG